MDETKDVLNETDGLTEPEAGQEPEPEQEACSEPDEKTTDKTQERLEALEAELETAKDRLLRTAAEFDNYRKRTEREKAASVSLGTANAVEKLLPVLDTLELAAAAETADEAYKKGVTMTLNLFMDALTALGVEQIEDVGAMFDPNLHCAVAREPAEDAESGTVVQVMRKGYKLGDKVIRPSMVSVAE